MITGMEMIPRITKPHSDWQPRPPVPRFRRVSEKYYEVSNFPLDWKMPRPFHVKSDFKTFKVRRRRPSVVEAFIKSCLPPVFMSVPEYAQRWGPSQIINAGWYMTVQEAIDEANGEKMVFIPEGTYDNLTITQDNTYIIGMSRGTVIDGGVAGYPIDVNGADDVILASMEVRTDVGGGSVFSGVVGRGATNRLKVISIYVNGSDQHGIHIDGTGGDQEIIDCYVYDTDNSGIFFADPRTKVIECTVHQTGILGIYVSIENDSIVTDNIINTTGDDGVYITGDNNIVTDNRITGWTNEPIDDDGYGNDTSHNKVIP